MTYFAITKLSRDFAAALLILATAAWLLPSGAVAAVSGDPGCQCKCCQGAGCTPVYIGHINNDGTCTFGCSNLLCGQTFGQQCLPPNVADRKIVDECYFDNGKMKKISWGGKFTADTAATAASCDPTQCCCISAGTVSVTQTDLKLQVNTPVNGQCNQAQEWYLDFQLNSYLDTGASLDGGRYKLTLADKTLVLQYDSGNGVTCNSKATCASGACSAAPAGLRRVGSATVALIAIALACVTLMF